MSTQRSHPGTAERGLLALLGACALAWGLWLALQHPRWPGVMLGAYVVWVAVSLLRPGLWLLVLPAALPLASLAPWTGWIVFDEFDLLVAASVATGCAQAATRPGPSMRRPSTAVALVIAALGMFGLYRGLADAGAPMAGLFEGYPDAANSVRVFKPIAYAFLVWPLVQRCFGDRAASALALDRFSVGMQLGLGVVVLAALQERLAYAGLLDFSSPYRTVALFWEMHVGGAAIDAYLALAAPFAALAWWSARTAPRWSISAALALATEYACLTSFSRGVYLAVFGPATVLVATLLWRQRRHPAAASAFRGRRACDLLLLAAMALLASAVLQSGAFMMGRIASGERDFRDRLAHWRHGLDLLKTPADGWLGIGLGRLPSHYAASAPGGEFSGGVRLAARPGESFVRLSGPPTLARLGGMYALTQPLPEDPDGPLTASFAARAPHAARLSIKVCEMRLLYARHCRHAVVRVEPGAQAWRVYSAELEGPPGRAARSSVFSVSVLDAASQVDIDELSLKAGHGTEQLRNGDFSRQLGAWFPSATTHFLPWHIDNLYLELLIERGVLGLLVVLGLVGLAGWRLAFGAARSAAAAPFLLASLAGVMTLGLVSSVMDVPRVAFGVLLVVLVCIVLKPE